MRVIIAGSRSFGNPKLRPAKHAADKHKAFQLLDEYHQALKFTRVLCGKAPGADTVGEEWANSRGIPIKPYHADWNGLGRSAGMARNREMAKDADGAVIFWDGKSPGTRAMIEMMDGKPVIIESYLPECTVVNIHKGQKYDVYVGRPSPWGNPFRIGDTYNGVLLDRDKAVECHRMWLEGSAEGLELLSHLPELIGKRLGCYCVPQSCHGTTLAELVNYLDGGND